ncbi:hypothetical protein Val02_22680 [Virgisporangium aliadipatigenens]|uniref:Glycosyltransferase n=1 Tax=Virgisporangium aliadipatigenens TaxID=741659 RepID=A0A8J3YJE3_9ACTN|nr:glycosyltransferase [Virgisporangium aliadipatigenens]GIJ45382.1 hypothetical protein Val02_22680 [Virgisporangium aliadipatigenens]
MPTSTREWTAPIARAVVDPDRTRPVGKLPPQRTAGREHDRRRIVALVPARDEAAGIAATIAALQRQWSPPIDRIVVVPNNCTDDTARRARAAGAEVHEYPGRNPHRKAGALNWALARMLPHLRDNDLVLVTDADSVPHPDFTQHAVRAVTRPRRGHRWRRPVGAACACGHPARAGRILPERWWRDGYPRPRRAPVLSGAATVFTVRLLREILDARGDGRLPGYSGEIYHRDTAATDIELTFAVQALGYRPVAPAKAVATSDSTPSRRAPRERRLRRQRGVLDALRLYGAPRGAARNRLRRAAVRVGSLLAPTYLVFLAAFVAAGSVRRRRR